MDFPIKNGDFPVKNADFPIKNGDFPINSATSAQPELRAFCFEVGGVFGRKGAPQTPQCEAKKDKTVPYIGTPIKKQ